MLDNENILKPTDVARNWETAMHILQQLNIY